jgi:mannosyl-oligosaccharide glucosidase
VYIYSGFLWDEGFHQLIVSRWDAAISRDILLHWFNLMQPSGWIPREQFIGGETRRRIERRWWTQNPTHANPPTLLLALQALMNQNAAPEGFLRCLAPKVKAWLDWFKRTQRAPSLHSFKWSGRVRTDGIWHTLSSGLDDYPRSNSTSSVADRHVDLYSWITIMHQVLLQVHQRLHLDERALAATLATLKRHVEDIHWDNSSGTFADRGYMQYNTGAQKVDFVPHIGYVSLFPFLLDILPADFDANKRQALIRMVASEKFLMSKAGLRSLSPTAPNGGKDPIYGTQVPKA